MSTGGEQPTKETEQSVREAALQKHSIPEAKAEMSRRSK